MLPISEEYCVLPFKDEFYPPLDPDLPYRTLALS
jgi:hypothetical protein